MRWRWWQAPASQKPVVRQRCYLFALDWIKRQANADDFEARAADLEDLMQKLIISGLTDVWSATRKVCAQRFKSIGQLLTLEQQAGLFRRLLDAWTDAQDAWKAKEGILLGLAAVIAQFSHVGVKEGDATGAEMSGEGDREGWTGTENEAGVKQRLRFGSQDLEALPSFITEHLKPLLFGALAHGQLSVRENAAKAFSAYLSRSPLHETQVCLAQVIRKLQSVACPQVADAQSASLRCGGAGAAAQGGGGDSRWRCGRLVEAFEAQGLLSLAIDLLQRLPSRLILQQWDSLIDTFSLYLSHSASTVRQACSSLFLKFMAKRDEGSASLQRLVLQGLSKPSKIPPEPSKVTGDAVRCAGMPLGSNSDDWMVQSSPMRKSPAHAPDARSHAAAGAEDDADGPEQTWEDREGRLLAYELVLGFLVEDHTLNVFKSDPRLLSPISPKKLSPVDCADYVHHFQQGADANLSESLEQQGDRREQQGDKRGRSPEGDSGWRHQQVAQSNLSPYNCNWLQSPAMGLPASLTASPASESGGEAVRKARRVSPHRTSTSPSRGMGRKAGGMSVLDTFRHSDDSPTPPLDPMADATAAAQGCGMFGGGLPVTFEPLGVVLHRMFDEVGGSIGHVRWELRRMGLQVLPLLSTTALWYDTSLLQQLWERCLLTTDGSSRNSVSGDTLHSVGGDSLRSYVAILVLKEIVKKVSSPRTRILPSHAPCSLVLRNALWPVWVVGRGGSGAFACKAGSEAGCLWLDT
jgi:hypothetical protein